MKTPCNIHPRMAQALAHFAPADSSIHEAAKQADEWVAADLAYNRMKDSGELRRREADRALAEQVKWEGV